MPKDVPALAQRRLPGREHEAIEAVLVPRGFVLLRPAPGRLRAGVMGGCEGGVDHSGYAAVLAVFDLGAERWCRQCQVGPDKWAGPTARRCQFLTSGGGDSASAEPKHAVSECMLILCLSPQGGGRAKGDVAVGRWPRPPKQRTGARHAEQDCPEGRRQEAEDREELRAAFEERLEAKAQSEFVNKIGTRAHDVTVDAPCCEWYLVSRLAEERHG